MMKHLFFAILLACGVSLTAHALWADQRCDVQALAAAQAYLRSNHPGARVDQTLDPIVHEGPGPGGLVYNYPGVRPVGRRWVRDFYVTVTLDRECRALATVAE